MKTQKAVLTLFMLLSILLPGCGNPAPTIEENTEITVAETTAPSQTAKESAYQFSVTVEKDRTLTVFLHLAEIEDYNSDEVHEIQIYDGDQLLQTITKEDIPAVTDYAWDGLFLNEGYEVGMPDVRDLNFDGAEDFGLLAVYAYPNNVPYSYFLWNEEKEVFEYQFTAFGPGWLQKNESEKCLVEVSTAGSETYEKCFTFDQDGNIVSGNQTGSGFASVLDIQDSDENILMQVLENKVPFYSEGSSESYTLAEYCCEESTRLEFEVTITRYAFVDMDGDGIREAVVDFCFGENSQVMCMVLKWDSSTEIVSGTEFYHRQMSQIKEDGSFVYSGGGDNDGWAKVRWEKNAWVKEDVGDSSRKTDVQWQPYPVSD